MPVFLLHKTAVLLLLALLLVFSCVPLTEGTCPSTACENGGTCLSGVCDCPDGFLGDYCEEVDDCHCSGFFCIDKCVNGAVCVDGVDTYTCECPPGFEGNDCTTNIDECAPSPCLNGGTCVDGVASYVCECVSGFNGDECENNIDDCVPFPAALCFNGATCNDLVNDYNCTCARGYESEDCSINTDNCVLSPCANGGTCNDGVASYTCTCADGWETQNCTQSVDDCLSVTEPCFNGGTCIDAHKNFTCACATGWNGTRCLENLDDCDHSLCLNGATCNDGINSFTCSCPSGISGMFCADECRNSPCENGGTCIDGDLSYSCSCAAGWEGDNCTVSVDECAPSPCESGGTCIDGDLTYTCQCPTGILGTNCEDGCVGGPCQNGGTCTDEFVGFSCDCVDGYEGFSCNLEVDECEEAGDPCQNGGTCEDAFLKYICHCVPGYNGTDCEINIDECLTAPTCENGGTCRDLVNNYTCDCALGYGGRHCEFNIDDCADSPCDNGGTCRDGIDSFVCDCVYGFSGTTCDINNDNCLDSPCAFGGTCQDQIANYTCTCVEPYYGRNCTNFAHCHISPCENGGTCVSDGEVGSTYSCMCPRDYVGRNCSDNFDKCSISPCQNGGTCYDMVAGYNCSCVFPYSGVNCTVTQDFCADSPCLNGTCVSLTTPLAPENYFYNCTCTPGFTGVNCTINIDDCADSPCLNGGTCLDRVNGFECNCIGDFVGTTCASSVDYCESSPCDNGGTCSSGAGYTCSCPQRLWSGRNCTEDLNACLAGPCKNGATCIDTPVATIQSTPSSPDYLCQCSEGWQGTDCDVDVDVCVESPCQNGGSCTDLGDGVTNPGYNCTCVTGYEGSDCSTNIDDCVGQCNQGVCVDGVNSFVCQCRYGFYGSDCQFLDGCVNNTARNNGAGGDPCVNGGACVPVSNSDVGDISCDCSGVSLNWVGPLCSQRVDGCNASSLKLFGPTRAAGQYSQGGDFHGNNGSLYLAYVSVTQMHGLGNQHVQYPSDKSAPSFVSSVSPRGVVDRVGAMATYDALEEDTTSYASLLCGGFGTCVDDDASSADDVDGFSCACSPGWGGAGCEHPLCPDSDHGGLSCANVGRRLSSDEWGAGCIAAPTSLDGFDSFVANRRAATGGGGELATVADTLSSPQGNGHTYSVYELLTFLRSANIRGGLRNHSSALNWELDLATAQQQNSSDDLTGLRSAIKDYWLAEGRSATTLQCWPDNIYVDESTTLLTAAERAVGWKNQTEEEIKLLFHPSRIFLNLSAALFEQFSALYKFHNFGVDPDFSNVDWEVNTNVPADGASGVLHRYHPVFFGLQNFNIDDFEWASGVGAAGPDAVRALMEPKFTTLEFNLTSAVQAWWIRRTHQRMFGKDVAFDHSENPAGYQTRHTHDVTPPEEADRRNFTFSLFARYVTTFLGPIIPVTQCCICPHGHIGMFCSKVASKDDTLNAFIGVTTAAGGGGSSGGSGTMIIIIVIVLLLALLVCLACLWWRRRKHKIIDDPGAGKDPIPPDPVLPDAVDTDDPVLHRQGSDGFDKAHVVPNSPVKLHPALLSVGMDPLRSPTDSEQDPEMPADPPGPGGDSDVALHPALHGIHSGPSVDPGRDGEDAHDAAGTAADGGSTGPDADAGGVDGFCMRAAADGGAGVDETRDSLDGDGNSAAADVDPEGTVTDASAASRGDLGMTSGRTTGTAPSRGMRSPRSRRGGRGRRRRGGGGGTPRAASSSGVITSGRSRGGRVPSARRVRAQSSRATTQVSRTVPDAAGVITSGRSRRMQNVGAASPRGSARSPGRSSRRGRGRRGRTSRGGRVPRGGSTRRTAASPRGRMSQEALAARLRKEASKQAAAQLGVDDSGDGDVPESQGDDSLYMSPIPGAVNSETTPAVHEGLADHNSALSAEIIANLPDTEDLTRGTLPALRLDDRSPIVPLPAAGGMMSPKSAAMDQLRSETEAPAGPHAQSEVSLTPQSFSLHTPTVVAPRNSPGRRRGQVPESGPHGPPTAFGSGLHFADNGLSPFIHAAGTRTNSPRRKRTSPRGSPSRVGDASSSIVHTGRAPPTNLHTPRQRRTPRSRHVPDPHFFQTPGSSAGFSVADSTPAEDSPTEAGHSNAWGEDPVDRGVTTAVIVTPSTMVVSEGDEEDPMDLVPAVVSVQEAPVAIGVESKRASKGGAPTLPVPGPPVVSHVSLHSADGTLGQVFQRRPTGMTGGLNIKASVVNTSRPRSTARRGRSPKPGTIPNYMRPRGEGRVSTRRPQTASSRGRRTRPGTARTRSKPR